MARKKQVIEVGSTPKPLARPSLGKYAKVTYVYKLNRYREVMDNKARQAVLKPVRDFEQVPHYVKVEAHLVATGDVAAQWVRKFNEKLTDQEIDNKVRIIKIEPWKDSDVEESVENTKMKSPVPDGAEEIKE